MDLFEGDIVLLDGDKDKVDTREDGDVDGDLNHVRSKRNVMRDRQALWAKKEVPYEFHSSLPGKSNLY